MRLLSVDSSHRYPRVCAGGEKRYLQQALRWDDDLENPHASNIH
ncbi:hypothetical protein [Mycobacteroides abscessus]|nr:hypothetical protein [Mycobacteroides abscessus]